MIHLKPNSTLKTDIIHDLIHGLSHNMGAPVRGLRQFSQLLQQQPENLGDKQRYWLSLMEQNATELQHMLEDLLSLARLATPEDPRQPFAPVTLCQQQVALLNSPTNQSRQAIISIEGEVGQLFCHLSHWQKLIHELVSNALLYQPLVANHQPQVNILWREQDEQLLLRVTDNGLGVNYDNIATLCTPFKRLQSETEYPGRGMGLCICQRIAQLQGGTIDFSPIDDGGLCVDYRVPVYNTVC